MTQKQPENVIASREKPDLWIAPLKSCVVQVVIISINYTKSLFAFSYINNNYMEAA